MTESLSVRASDRVIEPMIALARCTPLHRILVAGARSIELVFELQRRGFARVAATANCGRADRQYDAGAPFATSRPRSIGSPGSSSRPACW
jgi:hypothetical protein